MSAAPAGNDAAWGAPRGPTGRPCLGTRHCCRRHCCRHYRLELHALDRALGHSHALAAPTPAFETEPESSSLPHTAAPASGRSAQRRNSGLIRHRRVSSGSRAVRLKHQCQHESEACWLRGAVADAPIREKNLQKIFLFATSLSLLCSIGVQWDIHAGALHSTSVGTVATPSPHTPPFSPRHTQRQARNCQILR